MAQKNHDSALGKIWCQPYNQNSNTQNKKNDFKLGQNNFSEADFVGNSTYLCPGSTKKNFHRMHHEDNDFYNKKHRQTLFVCTGNDTRMYSYYACISLEVYTFQIYKKQSNIVSKITEKYDHFKF